MVERGQLWLPQALDHRENGGVDEADAQVGVGAQQLSDPGIIGHLELLNQERAATAIVEKPHEGIDLRRAIQQVLDLDQRRRGHDPILTDLLEQPRARDVVVIARLDRGEKDACIYDERQGAGSYTSSLANRDRSVRPERPVPMHVKGGGIRSSSRPPNSCSIASRTTWATETPRSAARRFVRSISSGSAWIISLCIIVQA